MKPSIWPSRFLAIAAAAIALSFLEGCVSVEQPSLVAATLSGAPGPQPQKTTDGGQLWLIPTSIPGLVARASVYRPAGPGPFPLVVISHGSEQDANARALAPLPSFPALTQWFVARGYVVVIPERPGHGKTGGQYLEDQGACDDADYISAGKGTANSIGAALEFMRSQPFVKPGSVVLVGNSAGALGDLAFVARQPGGIRAVIDFAGGRGGHKGGRALSNCSPDKLVAAMATFGKTTRVPSLWLYAANDTYFPPDLSRRMADAYRGAGGPVDYELMPAIPGSEGHGLIQTSGSDAPWATYVASFLKAH